MRWADKLKAALFGQTGFLDGEIIIPIPESVYIKELAKYTAISLIASAISLCEIVVYEKGEKVKNGDWYSLNVRPNPNESAPQFWHKVVEKMMQAEKGKGALVFLQNGNLYCADEYNIKEKRPFKMTGNLYDGVVVDNLQLNKTFTSRDVMIFKIEQGQGNVFVDLMYNDVSKIVSAAMNEYANENITRWKFKVNAREAGSEEFQKNWQNKLQNSVKKYVKGETQVFVEYDDRVLEPVDMKSATGKVSAGDNVQLINQVFELVGRAYHIPPGLMTAGNYNVQDLIDQFLTFCVDPPADMIGKTLTGAYGEDNFKAGNYYKVDTSKIKHFDIFSMAPNVDKLISSGFASVNEVRQAADWDAAGDPDDPDNWLNQHILTKNYEKGGNPGEEQNPV